MIKVLYFASLRERLGTGSEELVLPASIHDLAGLAGYLAQRGGVWAEAFGTDHTLMMALNQEAAQGSVSLADGDEVAFYPPVTGG